MSMNVNMVITSQPKNAVQHSSSKVSKQDNNTFAKLLQSNTKESVAANPDKLDLESKLKQLQHLIARLQLTNQPIEKLEDGKINQKLVDLIKNLPAEIQQKVKEIFDQANTFKDLTDLVKQDLNEVNLLALSLAVAGNYNQLSQVDKNFKQIDPGNGPVNTTNMVFASVKETGNKEQDKLLTTVKELIQQQVTKPKAATTDKIASFKKFVESNTLPSKTVVGLKLSNQHQLQLGDSTSKQVNEQNLGSIQFPLSQQAQYKLHVTPERVADNRFINELQSIIQSGKLVNLKNGETQFQIKLFPEHLGKLDITIIQRQGELLAKITASTQNAKDLIESQLHQLKHAFQGQNIQVDKIEVQHQRFESTYQQQQQQQQDTNNGKNQQQRDHDNPFLNDHENETEIDSFSTLLNEMSTAL